jgi:hypothetical protein
MHTPVWKLVHWIYVYDTTVIEELTIAIQELIEILTLIAINSRVKR